MSSTVIRSHRVILAMALAVVPSTAARPRAAVSDSRVNQATRLPASMALCASASAKCDFPVPDGPAIQRFSARVTHSRVARACWAGSGMEESVSRQDAKVFPAGSPAALRRIRRPASSRPRISSSSRMRTTSAGSHRWALAVARTSGAAYLHWSGPATGIFRWVGRSGAVWRACSVSSLSGSGSWGSRAGRAGVAGAVRCSGVRAFRTAGRWPATGQPGDTAGGSQAYLGPRAGAFMLAAR
jgi:hypothetical protein